MPGLDKAFGFCSKDSGGRWSIFTWSLILIYIEEQPFGYSAETDWGGAREERCCMHRPGGGE